jgi:hypothetical protein
VIDERCVGQILAQTGQSPLLLEMWQGSQNLCPTQKESSIQNKQMTAAGYISDTEEIIRASCISNNPSFRLKHPGVPDGSDGSDGPLNPLTENYTLRVAPAMGRVAYSPPLLCAQYTHHQNDTCVTLFAGAAVML